MGFIVWDILLPGRLVKRREEQEILSRAVNETLSQFQLPLEPPGKVALSEFQFRQLVEVMSAKLAPYNSKFSGEDMVKAIRGRGYEIKPPERKRKKIPIWLVIGAALALIVIKGKERKEVKR